MTRSGLEDLTRIAIAYRHRAGAVPIDPRKAQASVQRAESASLELIADALDAVVRLRKTAISIRERVLAARARRG